MTYQEHGVEFPFDFRAPLVVERPKGSGTRVRFSEDVRKCVVYLGHEKDGTEDGITPVGTGFLVSNGEPGGKYLITAGHVAKKLEDQAFAIRINQKAKDEDGKRKPLGRLLHIDEAKWYFHPTDDTCDLAAMPFEAPEWADVTWWPARNFASEFKLVTKNIGAGDFVYVVGILPVMEGKKRNMPAVHTGHIVLMQEDEKVSLSDWRARPGEKADRVEMDVYLVQTNALPSSSGSPAFVRRTIQTKALFPDVDGNPINIAVPGSLWFLGIWRSAYFGPTEDPLVPKGNVVPYGLGTVVPAPKVEELLDREDLQKLRLTALRAEQAQVMSDTPLDARAGDSLLGKMLNTAPKPRAKPGKKAKKKRSG